MKKEHILLIDDNEVDNYISKYIITQNEMAKKITVINSAVEALKYLKSQKNNPLEFPDLIFLDIRMPKMDGFDFLEEFTKFPQAVNDECPVIMLSSSNDRNDIDRALQFPVVKKYLTKPLVKEMLEDL